MENIILEKSNLKEISNKVKTYGICVIKNYITKKEILKLTKEFLLILDKYKNKLDKSINNRCLRTNVNSNIINSKKFSNINKIFTSNFIKNISNNILDKWNFNNIFIHQDFKNENTNNVYPHFDYIRQLKFYLCLNDMGLNNGCFKALPGSLNLTQEKRKINPRMNIFKKGHKLYNGTEIKREELIPIIANAGDLIIFDTNCIHCGGDSFKDGKHRKVIRLHIKK